ncbi:hypothetical protein [Polaribacter sp.]|uniref:hypothetical protein n=1 Tax=Polaribacter sp. TaxID=1920175 RepID=UPI00404730A2
MNRKISIRISDSLRNKLSEISEIQKISVSELSRTILEQYFISDDNSKLEDDTNNFKNHQIESEKFVYDVIPYSEFDNKKIDEQDFEDYEKFNHKDIDVVNTFEFLQLITWMFDQRESRLIKLNKNELKSLKNTATRINSSNLLNEDIKDEFNKVVSDLIKEIRNNSSFSSRPNFAYKDQFGFNYPLLTEFIFKENLGANSLTI